MQLLAWLVAALLLAACNNSVDEQALLASAQTQLDKSEFAPAVAQMKTLLQHNPKSAPGRLLLGRALLGEGEPAAAEAELRRALDHGTTPQEAVLPMVAALAAQQKYAQLIKEFGSVGVSNRNDWVEMKTQLGQAYAHTRETATAERTVDEVLQRVTAQTPAHAAALVLKARLLAERGDTAAARAMADALLARYPGHAEAWMLHGDLLQADQTKPAAPAEAVAAYTKALGLKPRLLAAHVALLGLLIRTPDLEAANKAWVAMKAALPNQEATQFYEALLAHLGGDHQRTRTITQMLLRATPDEPRTLMLAARAELALGAFAQAETMLQKLALALPQAMQPRLLLAQALLRNGRATRALESLAVPLAAAKPHADVLALAGQAHLLLGDLAKADGLFAQALAIKPGDVGNRAAQVPSMFVGRKDGKDDLALAELQAIASTDSAVAAADLAPISGRMRRGEFDSALKAVDQLAGKFPQQALPEHLRARIALLRKDVATARASFEQALAKDAAYAPAVLGLADLDLAQDKPEAAKVRLEALLKQDPNNGQALLGLAEVARRSGATPSAVASALGRAAKASPSDAMVQRALIDDQLRAGDGRAAAATAKAALAAVPDEPELLERLGRAQMMADQPNQAVATFNKLAAQRPNSAPVQLQLADAYLADKNEVASASAVRRALVMAPDDAVALRAVIMLTVRENKLPQALAMARTVQTKQPADALGFLLEGDIHASQKDWAAAATVLRKALTKSKPEEVPARLHLALLNAEQAAEAAQFAQSWLKGHPSDTALRTYLGEAAILRGEGDVAEEHFRKLLELQPDEPSVLNNLAKLLVKFKKPGALPFAERAATLAPQRPDVLDTLAQAYAAENQTAKAIDAQRKALNLAPLNADLRLTLAKLYVQAADKERAQDELMTLAQLGARFPRQNEVASLRNKAAALASNERALDATPRSAGAPSSQQSTAPSLAEPSRAAALVLAALLTLGLPLVLIIAALRPAELRVARTAALHVPMQQVFDLLQDFRQWQRWSPWKAFDPALQHSFTGAAFGKGAIFNWQDERKNASGYLEIVQAAPPFAMAIDANQQRPQPSSALTEFVLNPDPNGGTVVNCTMRVTQSFAKRVLGVLQSPDKRLGLEIEANLAALKVALEAAPAQPEAAAATLAVV